MNNSKVVAYSNIYVSWGQVKEVLVLGRWNKNLTLNE